MNKKEIALIVIVILLSIVLVIGGTYAFYTATITGNEDAENITIASGYLELTFDEGGSNINIEGALPTSKGSKTFTVENTSTANIEFNYNIKLSEVETTFEQKDLVYTLEEYEGDTYETPKEDGTTATGYINKDTINEDGEMYLAINIPAPAIGNKHYYKLTIEFKETEENQDYNKGKSFTGKINGDDNRNAKLYEPPKPFSEIIKVDNTTIFDDEAENIRYAGPSEEVNNYIWFNCNDYEGLTKDNATEKGCEKWRIIGLFKNITKTEGGEEDLVKIIRDSAGRIAWNSATSNNWTNASLKTQLEGYYNGTTLSSAKGITESTKPMIEQVTWNLGGWTDNKLTAQQFYEKERGETVPSGAEATWDGYIGLMYPSDYGYATTGSDNGNKDRAACLTTTLYSYDSDSYCYEKDWLYISGTSQWTLTPVSSYSNSVFSVNDTGNVTSYGAYLGYAVRPSLYLKSNVQIVNGEGTSDDPYVLTA